MDAKSLNLLFFTMAVSFLVTVAVFVFLVRRASPAHRLHWLIGCTFVSVLWLGIYKGLLATAVSVAFTSGYVSTRLDARRIGKKVADSLGVERDLLFSALENALPMYLHILAQIERQGIGVNEAKKTLIPHVQTGLHALQLRFGTQPKISAALETIAQHRKEWTD